MWWWNRWTVKYDRRDEKKVEKWASFTRPRLVPKAGRAMEGWVKRQQVRQTHKHMEEKKQHTLK